jgi:hypothetical protein
VYQLDLIFHSEEPRVDMVGMAGQYHLSVLGLEIQELLVLHQYGDLEELEVKVGLMAQVVQEELHFLMVLAEEMAEEVRLVISQEVLEALERSE